MQASSINSTPSAQAENFAIDRAENTSSRPTLPETSSHQSQNRWVILFLLCASTFGVYMFSNIFQNAENVILTTLQVKTTTHCAKKEGMERIIWVIPFLTGLAIYRLGIIAAYRFFAKPYAVGAFFLGLSFNIESYSLYFGGDLLMKGSSYGFGVLQMEMIIKYFRGKELSLAIGIAGSSRYLAEALGTFVSSSFLDAIGLNGLGMIGVVFCLLGDLALNFMTRIYLTPKDKEEERLILEAEEEYASWNKPIMVSLALAIICISVADALKATFMNHFTNMEFEFHLVSTFLPVVFLPIFGFKADRIRERISGGFASFLLLSAGNVLFFLFLDSETRFLPASSLILFKAGVCLLQVSLWAVLGSLASKKYLGIVLGIPQAFICLLSNNWWQPSSPKSTFLYIGFLLIAGIGALYCGRKLSEKKKIAAAKKIKL